MSKEEFFKWLKERFISVYNESQNMDFVRKIDRPEYYEDTDFVSFLYARMRFVYEESINFDYMHQLKSYTQ